MTFTLLLLAMLGMTMLVSAQWGGSFGNDGANPVPGGSSMFGSTGPNPATGGPGQFGNNPAQAAPDRKMGTDGSRITGPFDPFPKNLGGEDSSEFDGQWVPTGRPGFDPPPSIKKMMERTQSQRKGPAEHARTQGKDGFAHSSGREAEPEDVKDADDEVEEVEVDPIPQESPGRKGQGRKMDKCLRQVAHFCSMRIMQENFAAFNDCVYQMRYRLRSDCTPWAEGHGFCIQDMVTHCPKMSPADTTECLHKKKMQLSKTCVDSPFYASMEEGFKEFRAGMKEGMKGNPKGHGHYGGPQTTEEEEGDVIPPHQRKSARHGSGPKGRSGGDEDDVIVLEPKMQTRGDSGYSSGDEF